MLRTRSRLLHQDSPKTPSGSLSVKRAGLPSDVAEKIDKLAELREDNKTLVAILHSAHETTSSHDDHATTRLIENWIDETERRLWFLFETTRRS